MTTTTNLAVTKIDSSQAQKEVTANEAFDVFDAALSEISIALPDGNYTLSTSTSPQEWQYGIIKLTGALTANRNLICPTNKKAYTIVNATTGGYSITLKTSGGTGIAVPANKTAMLRCDGTNVEEVSGVTTGTVTSVDLTPPAAGITVSGGPITGSGSITLTLADDLAALEALASTGILERTGTSTYALRVLDSDGAMAANSATRIPAQSAVVTYVAAAVASLVASAPSTLDTLDEIAAALADDPNFATTMTTALGLKAAGPSSATDGHVVLFDGSTGKVLKSSGLTLAGTNTGDETTTTAGALINGATSKSTPVDADYVGLMDSAASNVLKKLSWANIKATLAAYFDTLYAPLSQPFDMSAFYPGVPGGSALVLRVPVARSITFPANFAGSKFAASANATATTVFDVKKNGSSIGSISIAAGGTTATFTTSGGSSQSFVAGDVLSIVAPASPDATLADPGFVLTGTR